MKLVEVYPTNLFNILLHGFSSSCGGALDQSSDRAGTGDFAVVLFAALVELLLVLGCAAELVAGGCSLHLRLHQACLGVVLVGTAKVGLLLVGEHFLVVDVHFRAVLELLLLAGLDVGS